MLIEVWISDETATVWGRVFLLQQRWIYLGFWRSDSYVQKAEMWREARIQVFSLLGLPSTSDHLIARERAVGAVTRREGLQESTTSQPRFYLCFRSQTPVVRAQIHNAWEARGRAGRSALGPLLFVSATWFAYVWAAGQRLRSLEHMLLLALGPERVTEQSGGWQNT